MSRVFSRRHVIDEMRRQDGHGRHRRELSDDHYDWIVPDDHYVLAKISLRELDAVAVDPELAVLYSQAKTAFPPIIISRRKNGSWYVRNGNHRVIAAALRGDVSINAFVPVDP